MLPGWAGPLDLVVVLAPAGGDSATGSAVFEALRRGCQLVVACPVHSVVASQAAGRHTTVLPVESGDQLAAAVVVLEMLARLGLGPETDPEEVAAALDEVAVECSPFRELSLNPAKLLAMALADSAPLVWGGSVLAARAARRFAESLRRTSGRAALASDAEHLLPVLSASKPRDVFADPFTDGEDDRRPPTLVVLDDGASDPSVREQRGRLAAAAQARDLRVETVTRDTGNDLARYAFLLATGSYAATYLGVGLDRTER
jgi:hypothetical protein